LLRRGTPPISGLLVGFHGYAENAAHQLDRLTRIPAAERWNVLSVQALNRFYRGRTEDTVASWMTREDRLTAIADNVEYVDAAVNAVGHEAAGVVIFAGFSQGVAMAFRAAVRGARMPRGLIAVGGDVPPDLFTDAARWPDVLLVRGEEDEWYTQEKMAADLAALTSRGVHVRAEVLPGGHEWTGDVSAAAGQFLRELARRSDDGRG
jgi:predicted esterase